MSVGEWYIEIRDATNDYNAGIITLEKYDERMKYALETIYNFGEEKDKASVIGIATAHGYYDLIRSLEK